MSRRPSEENFNRINVDKIKKNRIIIKGEWKDYIEYFYVDLGTVVDPDQKFFANPDP